jgi:tetratricopeptide (TPR) repeat protein
LGSVFQAKGDYGIARMYFLRALRVLEEEYGESHRETALAYHNIGGLYLVLGLYEEAERFLHEALTIRREILPEDHPDIDVTLNEYIIAIEKLGRQQEAEQFKK